MSTQEIYKNFELLRNIIRPTSSLKIRADLSKVDKIINHKLEQTIKDYAPPNFYAIYADFKAEYEKFKDFILYEHLIGKNIIALGGGFSSGKSSFLNTLMDNTQILPTNIDPSTSVPTFIVKGEKYYISGINAFDAAFEIPDVTMIRHISHGFGRTIEQESSGSVDVVTLGHIIESLFFATHLHKYEHIAFLDTPGYSNPSMSDYSAKTDEHIARRQLNTANYILWFVQADAGTITDADIKFIKTLNENIPKVIILNKADKKQPEDLKEIIAKIKSTLDLKGVKYEDVLAYSCADTNSRYDRDKIVQLLNKWNIANEKNNFAINFKKLFVQSQDYYSDSIESESKILRTMNKALTLSDDVNVSDSLNSIIKNTKNKIEQLENIKAELKNVQTEFFTEIKLIGDIVGIKMPEPSELDIISDKITNPNDVLLALAKRKGMVFKNDFRDIMSEAFVDTQSVINNMPGGSEYKERIAEILKDKLNNSSTPNKIAQEIGGKDYQDELIKSMKLDVKK